MIERATDPFRDLWIALWTVIAVFLLLALVRPSFAAAQTLDHFTCYRTANVKGAARFQRVSPVRAVHQFRESSVDVCSSTTSSVL
jgi:hypothetical protein